MRLQLTKLLAKDKEANTLKVADFPEDWEDVKGVLGYQGLLYVPEIICSKVISCHHNDLLARHFRIDKTQEPIGWKYYWLSLRKDVKSYIKRYDVCLTSKVVRHKSYGDLKSLLILTYQ